MTIDEFGCLLYMQRACLLAEKTTLCAKGSGFEACLAEVLPLNSSVSLQPHANPRDPLCVGMGRMAHTLGVTLYQAELPWLAYLTCLNYNS